MVTSKDDCAELLDRGGRKSHVVVIWKKGPFSKPPGEPKREGPEPFCPNECHSRYHLFQMIHGRKAYLIQGTPAGHPSQGGPLCLWVQGVSYMQGMLGDVIWLNPGWGSWVPIQVGYGQAQMSFSVSPKVRPAEVILHGSWPIGPAAWQPQVFCTFLKKSLLNPQYPNSDPGLRADASF